MIEPSRPPGWSWITLAMLAWLACAPARAAVTVAFDRETLNDVLPALTVNDIVLPLGEGRSVDVFLEGLEVTGFDPGAGEEGSGHILTSLTLRVPQFGLAVPLEPRLSLHVNRRPSGDELELRFERAELPLPLAGRIDVARFLPPITFPAENLFLVTGGRGSVRVTSRLTAIQMGQKVLRFDFELEAETGP